MVENRKLEFELVPSTAWGINLRELFTATYWKKICMATFEKAEGKCQICGKSRATLETHETWEYDDDKHIQTLKCIRGVCKICHLSIHIGNASILNLENAALANYQRVNNLSKVEVNQDLKDAWQKFNERSNFDWELNVNTKIIENLVGEPPRFKKKYSYMEKIL